MSLSVSILSPPDLDATYVDWRMSFDVNVVGFANMVQAVEPFMKKGRQSTV